MAILTYALAFPRGKVDAGEMNPAGVKDVRVYFQRREIREKEKRFLRKKTRKKI